jgi:tetratricopeptide (TPR) repeat protein
LVRYSLLETIRQYARQKLLETDEALKLRNRHLDYFTQLSEWANQNWYGPKQKEVEKLIRIEQANYRAALAWAFESSPEKAIQLISWVVMVVMYLFQGNISEAKGWSRAVVDRVEKLPPIDGEETLTRKRLLARGYDFIAGIDMNQGDHQASRNAARKSVELAREINDLRLLAQALASLGIGELYSGDPEAAFVVTQESISISKQLGLRNEYAWALNTMTHVYTVNGDDTQLITTKNEIRRLEQEVGIPSNTAKAERDLSIQQFKQGSKSEALQHAENAFALFEEQGDKYDLTFFKSDVAHALRQSEDLTRALSYYRQSILLWQDFGHRAAVAHQLECFALIALAQGQNERATKLFSAADNSREISRSIRTPVEQDEFEKAKSKLKSVMGEDEFNKSWNDGRSITMEQAIEFALEETR